MSEEYLYHITPEDEVLGRVSRTDAHEDPSLIHREVGVLLGGGRGRVLLAKRSESKKILPGMWDITCAGHVPWGMGSEEAAHMELREELGFDTSLEHVGRQLTRYDWETHLTHLFFGRYQGEEIVLQESEVVEARLFRGDEMRSIGDELNIEFRDFIYSSLGGEVGDYEAEPWEREYDLRSCGEIIVKTDSIRKS